MGGQKHKRVWAVRITSISHRSRPRHILQCVRIWISITPLKKKNSFISWEGIWEANKRLFHCDCPSAQANVLLLVCRRVLYLVIWNPWALSVRLKLQLPEVSFASHKHSNAQINNCNNGDTSPPYQQKCQNNFLLFHFLFCSPSMCCRYLVAIAVRFVILLEKNSYMHTYVCIHQCVCNFQIKHLSIENIFGVCLLDDTAICVLLNPCIISFNGLFCAIMNGNGNFNGSYGTWNAKVLPCKLYGNKLHLNKRYNNETTINKTPPTNEDMSCSGFSSASCIHNFAVSHCVFWHFGVALTFFLVFIWLQNVPITLMI